MKTKFYKPAYFLLAIFVLAIAAYMLPQTSELDNSLAAIGNADFWLLGIGFVCVLGTYAAAALTLYSIALKPIDYLRTFKVQMASGFATKLMPAGIGGLALNTRFLHKNKHNLVQATSVTALNNGLGLAGHVAIIIIGLLASSRGYGNFIDLSLPSIVLPITYGILLLLLVLFLAWPKLRKYLLKVISEIINIIRSYYNKPSKLLRGFVGALLVTLLFTTCLWLCAKSLGVNLSILEVLWVFTIGLFGATITPTPGGVGGAEAALTAGLVSLGVDTPQALSVALTFRLVSFWAPIIPGSLMFYYVLRKKYI